MSKGDTQQSLDIQQFSSNSAVYGDNKLVQAKTQFGLLSSFKGNISTGSSQQWVSPVPLQNVIDAGKRYILKTYSDLIAV